jgi:hypothetical protein
MKKIIDAKEMNTREINTTIKKVIKKNSNDKFYYENISNTNIQGISSCSVRLRTVE